MTTDISTAKVITQHGPRDFDATFDGNYIGSFRTQRDAEIALDDHVMDLIEHGLIDAPLTALDAQPCIHCGAVQDRASCDACVAWPEVEQAQALDAFQAELIADLAATPCEGLEHPCPNAATQTITTIPGYAHDQPIVVAMRLCDACAANWREWQDDRPLAANPPHCTMNALGTHWTVCGAPSDEPCMCDVVVQALDPDPPPWDAPAIVRKTIVAWQCNRTACAQWLATFNDAEQRMLAQAVIAYRRQFFATDLTVERLVSEWKGGGQR